MNPQTKTKIKVLLGAVLGMIVLAAVFQDSLLWATRKLHRDLYPEQIADRPVYDDTAKAPVDLAKFVRDARQAWPQAGVRVVHGAAMDVATGLLLRPDIEAGSIEHGTFVPWDLSPRNASARIRAEIGGNADFLSDYGRYVFRRKAS